jgi:hypothetical protein
MMPAPRGRWPGGARPGQDYGMKLLCALNFSVADPFADDTIGR